MKLCERCGAETKRLLSCDHTDGMELCVECYQEVHYELANKQPSP